MAGLILGALSLQIGLIITTRPSGLAIYRTVLAFNLVGDGLPDLLDPKSRG